jgi:hypothetical protein
VGLVDSKRGQPLIYDSVMEHLKLFWQRVNIVSWLGSLSKAAYHETMLTPSSPR